MSFTFSELRRKEVISIKNGEKLGFADDAELDSSDHSLKALIILGRAHFFGLLGRDDDIIIPADSIHTIGRDTVLVTGEGYFSTKSDS